MPLYPFECERCGATAEVFWSIHDKANLKVPRHCRRKMIQIPVLPTVKFAQTTGRWSGVYDNDYGKRATEDLTVPGKMEELKRLGRIADPFDEVKPRLPSRQVIEEICGDPTPAERASYK